jgi:hypothetical protein
MPNTHECAADGCTILIPLHLLMCRRDWYLVPRHIQREVYRAYKRRPMDWDAYSAATRAAKDAVAEARRG